MLSGGQGSVLSNNQGVQGAFVFQSTMPGEVEFMSLKVDVTVPRHRMRVGPAWTGLAAAGLLLATACSGDTRPPVTMEPDAGASAGGVGGGMPLAGTGGAGAGAGAGVAPTICPAPAVKARWNPMRVLRQEA